MYIEQRGAKLPLDIGEILVKVDVVVDRARIADTSRVVITGAISVTSPVLQKLADEDIPVCIHVWSGAYIGGYVPASGRNVLGRMAQHRVAADPERSLVLARAIVVGRIRNQHVLLRRNAEGRPRRLSIASIVALRMPPLGRSTRCTGSRDSARIYFEPFAKMLKERALAEGETWSTRFCRCRTHSSRGDEHPPWGGARCLGRLPAPDTAG